MKNIRVYITELTGTFFLVFVGCSAIAVNQGNGLLGHLGIAIVFGVVVTINIYTFGHISGCHINPAVTIAFACVNLFPWKHVVPYIIFQILGAILGSLLSFYIFGKNFFSSVTLPADYSMMKIIIIEFILTSFLMITIISVATDQRSNNNFAGLIIGLVILIAALVGGPISGASLNPARSLGPALISGNLNYILIYIFSPIVGAITGSIFYEYIKYGNLPQKREHSYGVLGEIDKIS